MKLFLNAVFLFIKIYHSVLVIKYLFFFYLQFSLWCIASRFPVRITWPKFFWPALRNRESSQLPLPSLPNRAHESFADEFLWCMWFRSIVSIVTQTHNHKWNDYTYFIFLIDIFVYINCLSTIIIIFFMLPICLKSRFSGPLPYFLGNIGL